MKNQLRQKSIEKRKKLDTELLSSFIVKNLFSLNEYQNSTNILCYYPLKYEVNITDCVNDKNKNVFLPRVVGQCLEICPYEPDKLKIGAYNITEPQTNKINTFDIIDLVIIPAVAADINGYRLGYGKGYYDRLLSTLPSSIKKVVPVYSDLLYETIYPEMYDVKSDIIVTDKEILRI